MSFEGVTQRSKGEEAIVPKHRIVPRGKRGKHIMFIKGEREKEKERKKEKGTEKEVFKKKSFEDFKKIQIRKMREKREKDGGRKKGDSEERRVEGEFVELFVCFVYLLKYIFKNKYFYLDLLMPSKRHSRTERPK